MRALVLRQDGLRAQLSSSFQSAFGSRMRTSILVPGVFLLVAASWRPTRAEDCCQTKTVRDAPEEVSELNGVYTLKTKEDTKPDPSCMDGCVYLRDNEEYCFVEKPTEEGATVVCEVSIHFLFGNVLIRIIHNQLMKLGSFDTNDLFVLQL